MNEKKQTSLPIPLYYQVVEKIKTLIMHEKFNVDDKFYSERILAKKFDVARITVNRAFKELVKEEILYKKSGQEGRGTFIGKALSSIMPKSVLALGFVVHNSSIDSSFNARMLLELQIAAEEKGHSLYFFHSETDDLQEFVNTRKIDSLIITGCVDKSLIKSLKKLGTPFVIIGNYDIDDHNVNVVKYGLQESVFQAVESVISDDSNVALLGCGFDNEVANMDIALGINDALQQFGLTQDKLITKFSMELDGFSVAKELFTPPGDAPTVIVLAEALFPGVAKYLLVNGSNTKNSPVIIVVGSSYLGSELADLIDVCVVDTFPETGKCAINQVEKIVQHGNTCFFHDCIKLRVKFNIKKSQTSNRKIQ